jgi:hypothetical protein
MKYHVTLVGCVVEAETAEQAANDFGPGKGEATFLVEPIDPETGKILTNEGTIVKVAA